MISNEQFKISDDEMITYEHEEGSVGLEFTLMQLLELHIKAIYTSNSVKAI